MTSNYDKYIRPEKWPVAPEHVGFILKGRELPGDLTEIRCISNGGSVHAERVYALTTVPREDASGAIAAVHTYCEACRKLIK